LEQQAHQLAQGLGVAHLELRHVQPRHDDWPRQDLYVTFRKALLPDEEGNMLAIPRKQRAMVRKGIKNALRSDIDGNVDRFFALYADNVHRHGTPALPKRYFSALRSEFGSDCEVLTVSAPDGRALSSVMSFYFRDEVLPYYAGGTQDARKYGAHDFMYWEVMQRAVARGCRLFDFGRSKAGTGAFSFKKNWGFTPEFLPYEFQLPNGASIPDNNPLNPKYRLFIAAWKRLPLPLANAIGPHIARGLG